MAGKFPGPDSKFQVCAVTDQKAEDHSGNQSCYSPIDHGEGVDLDHLALSPMLSSPVAFLQQIFPGGLDPGTFVVTLKQAGELGGIILGQSNTVKNGNGQSASGKSLGSAQKVEQLTGTEREINIAPDVREVEENGVKIRKIVEKGKAHKLDLLDGLPVHGALFDIAGFRLPEIKNIPTAKQSNDQMMSIQNLQQMAGQIMSLGQMIQGLAGNKGAGGGGGGYGANHSVPRTSGGVTGSVQYIPPGTDDGAGGAGYSGGLGENIVRGLDAPSDTPLYEIMDGLTPNMKAAVNSLSVLLQGYEAEGGVAFMTGDVVHEDTYLGNAQQLLSQVTNLSDLMYVLNRLQWDESLRGTEKLSNVKNEISTAWGVALQEIDYNGNIVITYGAEDANNELQFEESMTSNTGSPALGFFNGNNTEDVYYSVNATGASLGFDTLGVGGAGAGGQPSGGSKGGTTNAGQVIGQVQGLLGQIQGLAQGMSQNMFGESAGTMKEMWKRMARTQENDAKQMHKKLNQDGDTQRMASIVKDVTEGGKVFNPTYFDEGMLESIPEAVSSNFGVSINPNP